MINSLLLLPYAIVLRLVVFIFPDARIPGEIFGNWGQESLSLIHQWGIGDILISTLLVFIQSAMLNRLFIKQSMTGDINLFPGLSYILLTALHPAFISLSSLLLANTTLIIALSYLFDILKKDRQEETRFMVGWWFAVTGLIYTPYLILFLFGLISMSMLKTLKLKDIFQYVTGYLSPFLISWLVQIILQKDYIPEYCILYRNSGFLNSGLLTKFRI